jgi:hypothetical protein
VRKLKHNLPILFEIRSLSERAGIILLEILRVEDCLETLRPYIKSVFDPTIRLQSAHECWIHLLIRSSATQAFCKWMNRDGDCLLEPIFYGNVTGHEKIPQGSYLSISSYPQVCLAGLAWLKTEVCLTAVPMKDGLQQIPALTEKAEAPLSSARHSADFQSVSWFGQNYSFSKTQAACVEVLWNAWRNGTPEVANYTLLQTAKTDQDRVQDVFKRNGKMHPAWGSMIVSCTDNKGTYRLQEPPNSIPVRKSPRKSPR